MRRFNRKIVLSVLIALIAVAISACNRTNSGGTSGTTENAVAATVNGKPIMLSEVDNLLNQQAKTQQIEVSKMSPLELAAARMQVLDDLIKREVLFQRAEKESLLPSEDEITQAINQQKQQNSLTEEAYQKMLKDTGQTEQGLREVARKQIAINKLLDKVVSKIGTPSDKEVEEFYNSNRQRYVSARGVGLAAIVIDPRDNGLTNDAKSDTDAQNKANILHQRLKSGADFATVAREQSEDAQSSIRGGDIGFMPEDQLRQSGFPQDLIGKFFTTMQVGDITDPVKSPDGRWSIFKLTEKRLETQNLTLENPDVRKDITDNIVNSRKQIVNAALLEVAMFEAKIVNNLASRMLENPANLSGARPAQPAGAASPAASPSASPQASPSQTASASPAATTKNANAVASPSK